MGAGTARDASTYSVNSGCLGWELSAYKYLRESLKARKNGEVPAVVYEYHQEAHLAKHPRHAKAIGQSLPTG